jgi:hypothetical protein
VTASAGVAGSIVLGLACIVVGSLEAWQSVHLIVLERQGECDFIPWANEMTYVTAALFGLLAMCGAGLLAGVMVLFLRGRSRP